MINAFFWTYLFIVNFLALFVKVKSKTGKSRNYVASNILDLAYLQNSSQKKLNDFNQHKDFQRFIKNFCHDNETPWTRIRIIFERCETDDFFPDNC